MTGYELCDCGHTGWEHNAFMGSPCAACGCVRFIGTGTFRAPLDLSATSSSKQQVKIPSSGGSEP